MSKTVSLFLLLVVCFLPQPVLAESEPVVAIDSHELTSAPSEKLIRARELAEESLRSGGQGRMEERESMQRSDPSLIKGFQGLALTLGVFCILIFVMKKIKGSIGDSGERRIQILERTPLTSKTSLLRVQINGRESLIAVGTEQVAVVPVESTANPTRLRPGQRPAPQPFEIELEQSAAESQLAKAS